MAFRYRAGLGNAAAYIVSGKPFVKSEIDSKSSGAVKVEFPSVTRWIQIMSHDPDNADELFVAFSQNGLPSSGGTNHFKIDDRTPTVPGASPVTLPLKVTEIWLEGSDNVEIIAGLTSININEINVGGIINWSGSAGVG